MKKIETNKLSQYLKTVNFMVNHTVDCNQYYTVNGIILLLHVVL